MMKKILSVFGFVAMMLLPVIAVSQFKISAELRPRFEFDQGTVKPLSDTADALIFVSQRTRLSFDLQKEKYQVRLTLQDVRIWGDGDIITSTGVFGSTGVFDIQEAWFNLKLGDHSSLKIGRQVLILDNQRLIAGRNWNQFGLSYDALSYQFQKSGWKFNAALSYNNSMNEANGKLHLNSELFNKNNLIKSLNYLYLKRTFNEKLAASFSIYGAGYQKTNEAGTIYMMGTSGLWLNYKHTIVDVTANAYYQFGTAQTGKSVSAYMFSIDPGVAVDKHRFGIGLDYISGDDADNDSYGEKERTFNKMYGAVFKYYGYMNYYSYMKASTANGGLIDIYPNVSLTIAEKHKLKALYHLFSLANAVSIGNEIIGSRNMGSELDLMYTYKPMTELVLQAGISYYFTSETLKKVKKVEGIDTQSPYWAWVMITFKPVLFK